MNISNERLLSLPIFPLPEAHLFPGSVLPLHVFEPRYVDLVNHVMECGDNALAVATLKPGYDKDYEGQPPVYDIMGAGVIMAAERQSDGRWNMLIRGTDRIRMVSEHSSEHEFREIEAQRLVDSDVMEDHPLEERLRSMITQLADHAPGASEALHLIMSQSETASELTDLLGAHACSDPVLRQKLIECIDVEKRLQFACKHVGRLLLEVVEAPAGGRDTLH